MSKQNIVQYYPIKNNGLTVSGTSITLFELIESANIGFVAHVKETKKYHKFDTVRIYVISGILGLKVDNVSPTQTSYEGVLEGEHFIENGNLENVKLLGIGGDAVIVVQIGIID